MFFVAIKLPENQLLQFYMCAAKQNQHVWWNVGHLQHALRAEVLWSQSATPGSVIHPMNAYFCIYFC